MKHIKNFFKFAIIAFVPTLITPAITACTIGGFGPVDPIITTPKITFDPNGGKIGDLDEPSSIYVELNITFDKIACPTPTRDGYKFTGWLNPKGELMVDQQIVEDVELKASWEPLAPEIGDKVICTIEGNEWIADMDSLCSESAQISLTSLADGQQLKIDRDKFNANSIVIGEDISELPNLFMYKCSDFTGTITFSNNNPQLRDIGESFMSGCSKFDSKLVLPSSVRTILSGFMFGCSSFNSQLDLGPAKIIGQDFMGMCSSFAKKLTISNNVEYLGIAFMWDCRNFKQLEINCPSYALNSDDNSTLIVTTQDCPAYQGVYISGTCKSTFVGQFGTISTATSWRNLIEAE